jgi:hypothetical protein
VSDETQRALIVGLTTSVPAIISAYFAYRAAVISKKTEENIGLLPAGGPGIFPYRH